MSQKLQEKLTMPILMPLNIQLFAEGEGEGQQQQQQGTFEPEFNLTHFSDFLTNNADAKTLFDAKLEHAIAQREESLRGTMLEEAKKQLEQQKNKSPLELEVEQLRQETQQLQQKAQREAIKASLATKLNQPEFNGVDIDSVLGFVLKDTQENSQASFDTFMNLVNTVAEHKKNAELEQRLNGMQYNPLGGRNGAPTKLGESMAVSIARDVMATATQAQKMSQNAREHFNL